jgi:hypothetical protein
MKTKEPTYSGKPNQDVSLYQPKEIAQQRGGKRAGSGRPAKEPTTTIRVPVRLLDAIKKIIENN